MSPPAGGRRVHQVRRDLLFAAVRDAGRISRADLVRRTGMARMTVNGLVAELVAAGLLAEEEAVPDGTRAGRPARSVTVAAAAGGVVGAVVEADGVHVVTVDLAGRPRAERHLRVDTADPQVVLDAIAEFVSSAGRVWSTVVGLSAPISGGVVQSSSVLPAWSGIAAAGELRRRLAHRVTVRNDADLCVLGEVRYGVAAGHQHVCHLRVASGIGCGLLLGGVPHTGATGVAGEIGHVQVDETGALCRCGNRGCLETIASPREILAALSATYGEPLTAARAVELARHDATAERVLADAGRMIGRVVADLANTVNPSLVVLDGPLIEPDGPLVHGVRDSLRRYAQPEVAQSTQVRVSALGGRAALLGAVAAALRATPSARGDRAFTRAGAGPVAPFALAPAAVVPAADAPASRDGAAPAAGEGLTSRDGAAPAAGDPPPAGSSAAVAPAAAARRRELSPARRERLVRRDMITDVLRGRGPTARSDIVRLTRLPRAAVVDLLAELCHDGVVEPCPPGASRSGRPSPHFRLAAAAGVLLGLALGPEGVRAVVADGAGRVIDDGFRPLPAGHETLQLMRTAAEFARELMDRHGAHATVAVSVPSPVHPLTGRFGARSVLPMFSGFSPAEEIAAVLGRPVQVHNNAQLCALAEARRGAARGARDVLYLRADQFTGAGIVAGGRMHQGAIGYAGEVGHLNVREIGPLCICGSRGCLSAFLAPAYFGALLERPRLGSLSEDRLVALAVAGDRPARRALVDAGRLIGRTVTPLCDVLNPAVVVVGGRYTEPGAFVVDGVREALHRHCAPSAAAGLTVVPAALGRDAEPLGAIESLL
ncbi:ROK family protein [Actinoplanes teichomyceticus]|uniref:Putative NBD/HSP70 family sugar kinase n=1 Tax=Actinoplanes teichomyceticus TaxID=1867 RepID=A0A561VIM4_ACTTI|nr:ROK family transcriptional regulator [Actinoplanes teichomyceticus]TWG11424.1 putative NBD/HSP70 family sugar kinase [Actinoplanes teichomyceticus]GIF15763.1 hypothetical protein Ate01nite_57950 [Actinoplanes teichomyceticus]